MATKIICHKLIVISETINKKSIGYTKLTASHHVCQCLKIALKLLWKMSEKGQQKSKTKKRISKCYLRFLQSVSLSLALPKKRLQVSMLASGKFNLRNPCLTIFTIFTLKLSHKLFHCILNMHESRLMLMHIRKIHIHILDM